MGKLRTFLAFVFLSLITAAFAMPIAEATPVRIKVIKASGSFFPSNEPGPTISWAQKSAAEGWEHSSMGSRGPDAREFEINLPSGVWYFGASVPDGFALTYRPSPREGYRPLPAGGAPITIQSGGATDLVFSYEPVANGGADPANSRLTCLRSPREPVPATIGQEAFGTSIGVKVGLSAAFGGNPVTLELYDPAAKSKRLSILNGENAGDAGWQSFFSLKNGSGKVRYHFGQAGGGSITQWGFAASLNALSQADWSPLYSNLIENSEPPSVEKTSPCFNLGKRFFDGQSDFAMDIVTTPLGGKLVRATKKYSVRPRSDLEYQAWQAGQTFAFPKTAAVEGSLRVYLTGPTRTWSSNALRPHGPSFLTKEEGHCDLGYAKDDDADKTMRSECRISSLAYAVFVWTVNGKDMGMAISNEGGRVFAGKLLMNKALTCREPDAENPYPRCGNIEWHSELVAESSGSANDKPETFKKNLVSDYKMHYIFGSPQELADLGFSFVGGPRSKAEIAFNMQREGSASVALNGIDGAPVMIMPTGQSLTGLPLTPVAPLAVSAPGSFDEGESEVSPLASLLGEDAGLSAQIPRAPKPVLLDITKMSSFTSPSRSLASVAAVPLGIRGRALVARDLRVAGVNFRAIAAHSGKCLSVTGAGAAQVSCDAPDPQQKMRISFNGAGRSELAGGSARDACLKSDNNFKIDGAELTGGSCLGTAKEASLFEAVARADGRFSIRSVSSGKCLEVRGADQREGAKLQEFECGEERTNQIFTLVSYE
ncbi:MAG: hypothetical protein EOP11_04810 [Proteobacteria bacterium]|nr:MAG: hypothetical protein EOP11_04810 [Pseudomonadota bacterium]